MFATGEKVGNYVILAKLGEGGIGEVYLGEHRHIARKAAIKVLRHSQSENPEMVSRFFTEARAASLIQHPGIVEILDCDLHHDGSAFIVMELLEGEGLEVYIARRGSLAGDLPMAVFILGQIADALDAAHAKAIVHRDLKPANIFLAHPAHDPTQMNVKVLDFGIAKLIANEGTARTQTGSLLGTPLYMSPEQCRGAGHVDHRSDIYSLGCIAFELLTGRPPFLREGAGELIAAHLSEEPPPLTTLEPSIPAELDGLVMRMLDKSPDERPASMREIAQRLAGILDRGAAAAPASPRRSRPPHPEREPGAPRASRGVERTAATPTPGVTRMLPGQTTLSDAAAAAPPFTQTLNVRKGRGLPLLLLGAAAVAAGLVLWIRRPDPTPPVVERPSARPSAEATPPPPEPARAATRAEARTVALALTTSPSGAQVWVADETEPRGVAPLVVVVARATAPLPLRLTLAGYTAKALSVRPDHDDEIEVTLEKAAKPRPAARPRPARPRASDDDYRKLE
jgi:serine/threonine protein kinase